METIPTESDTADYETEPEIKCLDMVTQISKSRLSKSIRSIFAKYGLKCTLATSKSSDYSEFDMVVWTLPESNLQSRSVFVPVDSRASKCKHKLQWMLQVYDLKDFRYIDHSVVSIGQPPFSGLHTVPPKKPFCRLPVWAQQIAHSVMLELLLLLQPVTSSSTN